MVRLAFVLRLGLLSLPSAAACHGSEPDPAPARPSPAAEMPVAAASVAKPSASVAAPTALEASSARAPEVAPVPSLTDSDGAVLPQTEDRPSTVSPSFQRRFELLARAIARGEPDLAHPAFFPLVAYQQVKAIKNPAADYQRRLLAAFDQDILAYHRTLGDGAATAKLAGIEVPESRVAWMKPGREGNKVGYFRVTHSKLRFALESGKERAFDLTSLISWRGEWYVVHLDGFD